jgi:serine protease AprX
MTGTNGVIERMRWMSALALSGLLALALGVALHTSGGLTSSSDAVSGATPPPTVFAAAHSSRALDPRIAGVAARHPRSVVQAVVQFKAGVTVDRARWAVAHAGGHVFGELHIINALAVKLSAADARKLARSPLVHAVSLNAVVHTSGLPVPTTSYLQTTYDQTMGVLPLWKFGIAGTGVGVAVIDTGIAGNLPDFQTSDGSGSRVVESAVTNPLAQTAGDTYGHGTDVAGIIAGNGDNRSTSDPMYGKYIGVAPNANLISVKVSDDSGNATVLDVIYGLQFVVDHQSDYNIRVVNMSLDSNTAQSYTTDPLDAAAESAWMHGIVVVAAAGNRGSASDAVQYAPANDPYVITVGAADENGTSDPSDDTVASWSSQGTTQDGLQKPDIYAPGRHIVSVLAPNSAFASTCPSCIVGGQYIMTGGTSIAAPMLSGLVADLLQIHPSWSPNQVKGALTSQYAVSNSLPEVNAVKLSLMWSPPAVDQGLTPNTLITDAAGDIDYTRSSWSRSSWSTATGSLSAAFARSSWSCNCSTTSTGTVDPSRSSWSVASWSTYFGQ